jgi:hypothetical protein
MKKQSAKRKRKRAGDDLPLVGMNYLAPLLPDGFERLFTMRRAGRYWGLTVECPICKATPPRECDYGLRRWRWLSSHLALNH